MCCLLPYMGLGRVDSQRLQVLWSCVCRSSANRRHLLCVAVVKHAVEHVVVSELCVWSRRRMCETWSAFAFLLCYVVLPITIQTSGQLLVVGVFHVVALEEEL